jgi:Kelch motif
MRFIELLALGLPMAVLGCPAFLSDNFATDVEGGAARVSSDAAQMIDAGDARTSTPDAIAGDAGNAVEAGDASSSGNDAACSAAQCGANCVNLSSDDANCGACGYSCVDGRHCSKMMDAGGARCSPAWLPVTTVGAPPARVAPGASLSGKLIIAGGSVSCSGSLASAGSYDPSTDTWSAVPDLGNARAQHTVVSSGSAVYVFGGLSDCANGATQLASLERWTPGDLSWTVVNGANAPAGRYAHESAWTGSGLLIYGGSSGAQPYVTSGALFDPVSNAWTDASCSLSGCARNQTPLIIDQGFVRLWGGEGGNAPAGLQYEPSTGAWTTWTLPPNFPASLGTPADDARRLYFFSGGGSANLNVIIYDRQTQTQIIDSAPSPPNLSASGAIAWTGTEVVVWTGAGGRYQPPAP